jgi:hypothetical protein
VSITEEVLGRNNSGSGLESREYGRRDFYIYIYIYIYIYTRVYIEFGVGLESPFCHLQAIYIKLLQVVSILSC